MRLILVVAVLGILTVLLVQNWSPVLPLVFLGTRTLSLPLAMWIFLSTAAGVFTSLVITILLKISIYFGEQQGEKRFTSRATFPRKGTFRGKPFSTPPSGPTNTTGTTESVRSDAFDDWETNDSGNDDWDFDSPPSEPPPPSFQSYERQQEPQSTSQSGSVYSYNYRQPKNTAVGKTESVYDADYRVIRPPLQQTTTNDDENQADDDDWKFFDDDDLDDKDDRPRQ
ncbi:LapA family protein [Anabaenopsis elenkinii]|uniref:LapA family protein n=1 Tax=Anabaenopsis elenkinii CCIBt3563 TaxID=2779889 RepID=A0A7S6U5I8_9CYAN|nr:LapA family protein [Anabaenopsis elenkinii]QOV24511.1 LapA family protein [Anabaenopsis elenkinii CCIBt3563]